VSALQFSSVQLRGLQENEKLVGENSRTNSVVVSCCFRKLVAEAREMFANPE
jgi:hypothetical protein